MSEDFTLPTSRPITQPYGAEFDDWDGDGVVDYPGGFYHSIGWDGHNGIDYGCGLGDPIEAVADGYVAFAGWAGNHWLLSGGGNAILVEHRAHGVQTEYLHLSRFAVSAGSWVSKGQVIGYAGKTGAATGYHLHLGMLPLTNINVNNRMRGRIDPTPYLYGGGIAAQGTITPSQEDDIMANAPDAQYFEDLIKAVGRIDGKVALLPPDVDYWSNLVNAVARIDLSAANTPGKQYWSDLINAMARVDANASIDTDPKALANAIAEALPKADADALLDALHERLAK